MPSLINKLPFSNKFRTKQSLQGFFSNLNMFLFARTATCLVVAISSSLCYDREQRNLGIYIIKVGDL